MKKTFRNSLFVVVMSLCCNPVMAEAVAREDDSMTLVYFFLATCGLIIFLQLIPVFTMVYGMLKGVFGRPQKEVKTAPAKYR